MSEFQNCIITKETLQSQLVRFQQFLEKLYDNNTLINQLQIRLDKIQNLLNSYSSIHIKLVALDPDNKETYKTEFEEFEELYFTVTAAASDLLENAGLSQVQLTQVIHETNSSSNAINLPQIDLPTFTGDSNQWLEFNDTFTSLIENNESLSNVQKFYYLKSCLKKDAEAVIHSLKVSNDNYPIAWNLLRERYQNDKLIINSHIRAIFDLPPIPKESFAALRKLLDDVKRILRVLESFKQPVSQWDLLLIHLISGKLDFQTRKTWESVNITSKLPTMPEFLNFLKERCSLLETLNENSYYKTDKFNIKSNNYKPNQKTFLSTNKHNKHTCQFCNEEHLLFYCKKFLGLSVESRRNEVKRLGLCFNCLKPNHKVNSCSSVNCKNCGQRHNTLLHINNQQEHNRVSQERDVQNNLAEQSRENQTSLLSVMSSSKSNDVLLATAIVDVVHHRGNVIQARVLLDSGSQTNLITKDLVNRLQLKTQKVNVPVVGINQGCFHINEMAKIKLKSRFNSFQADLSFLIINKITDDLPSSKITFKIPSNINLADPTFCSPGKVEMLLGASIFYELMCIGQIKSGENRPLLQKTKLGWILAGNTTSNSTQLKKSCNLVRDVNFDLKKFWEMEECSKGNFTSQDHQECEKEFTEKHRRNEAGQFIVPLLFKKNIEDIGDTYETALKRLKNMERKFSRSNILKEYYINFMEEYESLGHMTLVKEPTSKETLVNYLPHHGVWKEDSSTTKLRVVFDGSCASSTGISLNDRLKVGPTIQQDLFSILVRFRKHNVVLSADIEKMYRQVLVQEEHQDLQRILWRLNPDDEVKEYKLKTVTYGTSSASYLAIRCLHQVGIESMETEPLAANIICKDFYVDDLLTGASSVEEATNIKVKLQTILDKAHFNLRKWSSNVSQIINNSNDDPSKHLIPEDGIKKTLGLLWNSTEDILHFTIQQSPIERRVTKRKILSTLSKTFDPLGLVGPCTIKAKLIMQTLWRLNLSWDESVPADIHFEWLKFQEKFLKLKHIKIPRQIICRVSVEVQIHGYSDASEQAYGACVYARSTALDGTHYIQLICAKSKVSPLKSISLPKLELCVALLLARLVHSTVSAMEFDINRITYWCDSQITLAWISGEPYKWKTFVANRVSEIQELTNIDQWKYVASRDNPADIISRGLAPDELEKSNLWWKASSWLSENEEFWPEGSTTVPEEIPECKPTMINLVKSEQNLEFFNKFSSLLKLQRVTAYIFRFLQNCKVKSEKLNKEFITVEELNRAMKFLIKTAQIESFYDDMNALIKGNSISKRSKLLALNPFIDDEKILRVGGRLKNATDMIFSQKFPIILPQKHKLTELIIQSFHYKNLHAGPLALLSIIRQQYWPISGKNKIKSVLKKCIICFRAKPFSMQQLMGNLPKERITATRPFLFCGTDFAGPFNIKANKLRNTKIIKVYLCIFVCFTTKATHLELVSDMSSDAFLNCLKRFIGRRGKPVKIFSDNGANFIGANSALKDFLKVLGAKQNKIGNHLASESIQWRFIPSRSPHQGGIWESAVKAAKFHLYRVLNVNFTPTFEMLHTLVIQIEACLNSRPLTPLSSDPQDIQALTPGHFLIGASLSSIPEPDLEQTKVCRLAQYQQITQAMQRFWSRWSLEYISTLQQRTKWRTTNKDVLKPGLLVILKEDHLPPLKWKLGRVSKVFPGSDGIIRVVSIKTQSGEVTRAVRKICVLPIEDNFIS